MNIPKKRDKGVKTESPKEGQSQPYLVAESVMDDFAKHLRFYDSEKAIARLQATADILERLRDRTEGETAEADLRLIRRIAGESKNKHYQQIMKAIIAAMGEGSQGIKAARETAARAVEIGFRWSIYYFGTLKIYKARLRSISRKT
jgi:hypothetical protein